MIKNEIRESIKNAVRDIMVPLMKEGVFDKQQHPLSTEQKQEVTKVVNDFLSQHPSGYNIGYGSNTGDDTAYISANKSNDYSGKIGQILYQTQNKYSRDLRHFASDLWSKHGAAERLKKNPAVELNRDDSLKQLDASSKHVDWNYSYADDSLSYNAGQKQMDSLKNSLERAAIVDPEGAKEIVKKNFPRDKQAWANEFIDHTNNNKAKWSNIYKV